MQPPLQSSAAESSLWWEAVLNRDARFDGVVFYAVQSTGIYCRPTCPSRRPNRDRVCFFESATEAEAAGYRPCKRCQPQQTASHPSEAKVLELCRYIEAQVDGIPTLDELGARVGLSPYHLQRLFKRILGVSPFQYASACRTERFKQQLQQGSPIADALYAAGYGASSRLYASAAQQLGMTPAAYQRRGGGKMIRYTIVSTPLGALLVAATEIGLCSVRLGETAAELEQELQQEFQNAFLQFDDLDLHDWTDAIVKYLQGTSPLPNLPYDVQASAFQQQVWQALQAIPIGTTLSYSELANAIGQPTSTRAVARACATNPVALVIPCHRVVPKNGGVGGYRWGVARKQALLELERQWGKKAEE